MEIHTRSENFILYILDFNKAIKKKKSTLNRIYLCKWCMRESNMAESTAVVLVQATARKS